jgi:hypothetical protein
MPMKNFEKIFPFRQLRLFAVLFCMIGIVSGIQVCAQTKTISGTVTDELKTPIPGVNVSIKGANLGGGELPI